MKFYFGIYLLLTACLVALPTGAVRACGDVVVNHNKAVSAPSDEEHCASSNDECVETHPGRDCPPDADGCGHCHCPGCGATCGTQAGFFKNDFVEISAYIWLYDRRAANFCYRAPNTSAHLSKLFQPPKA